MASRFWVGGTGTWDAVTTTHWSASSGGLGGASVPGAADTVTFDGASGGGTVTVNTNFSIVSLTWGAFTGTLDFATNNNSPTIGTTNGSGTGTRTLNMGTGTFTLSGTGTVWTTAVATNLTINPGTSTIKLTDSSATARTVTFGTTAVGKLWISAGTGTVTMSGYAPKDFDTTGFSGTINPGAGSISGHITLSATTVWTSTSSVLTLNSTTGVKDFTPNGVQINQPITVAGATSSDGVRLLGALDMGGATPRAFTLTSGSANLNGFNLTAGSVVGTGSTTRSFTQGAGTIFLTSSGTVWSFATTTNLTFSGASGTIKLTDTSSSAKGFAGGGLTYGLVWITGAGTGSYTISGANTISEFKVDTPPHTIIFTSGVTQSITTWTVNGVAGSPMSIQSSIPGSQATLSKSASGLGSDWLSIKDIVVTGGAAWMTRMPVDRGNNTGWRWLYATLILDYMGA